jgi:cysteine desulfurase
VQFGGAHENQRRPGTENVAAIAGMAVAAEWILRERAIEQERQRSLRDRLWKRIAEAIPLARQNGDPIERLANTLNISFPGIDSETILMALDLEGVCASSGSACMVGSVMASHVLLAMGLSEEIAGSAIRFSLGHESTEEEIDRAGEIMEQVMQRICSVRSKTTTEAYAA